MSARYVSRALIISLVGLAACPASAQHIPIDRVVPPPPPPTRVGEPTPQPPAAPPATTTATPSPAPPATSTATPSPPVAGPAVVAAQPQTEAQQIADLQTAVSALQTEVEQLRAQLAAIAPEPGDWLFTHLHPQPGVTCDGGSTMAVQSIIQRVHRHGEVLGQGAPLVPEPPPEREQMLPYWHGCRSNRR